jgi:hypothetical protein
MNPQPAGRKNPLPRVQPPRLSAELAAVMPGLILKCGLMPMPGLMLMWGPQPPHLPLL